MTNCQARSGRVAGLGWTNDCVKRTLILGRMLTTITWNIKHTIVINFCAISGFRHKVAENCTLLDYYAASCDPCCIITQNSAVHNQLFFQIWDLHAKQYQDYGLLIVIPCMKAKVPDCVHNGHIMIGNTE